MTKPNKKPTSTSPPVQQKKPTTLLALAPLTRSEIDALRQKKRHISAYYQKVLSKQLE